MIDRPDGTAEIVALLMSTAVNSKELDTVVAALKGQPGVRHVIGWVRLARIRYLCAWRLWKYDPRYRRPETGKREVSFIEPMRLWWRGELDEYLGRPLLGSRSRTPPHAK